MTKTITLVRTACRQKVLLLALVLSMFSFGKLIAQPLNGSYTIGTGGNYGTIAAALADLTTNGVSGPVTMTFLPGNYTVTTPILIGSYAGVGASAPLKFTSANRDSVTFTGTVTGAIIALSQCKYVTLEKVSVVNNVSTSNGSGIAIIGSNANNNGTGCAIKNCKVSLPNSSNSYTSMGILTTASATGYGTAGQVRADSIAIDSNIITGAYYGIYLYNPTTLGNAYGREIKIRGNTLIDTKYAGMYLYYIQNGIDVLNNTITINSVAFYGIYLVNSYNHFTGNNPHRFINNRIYNVNYGIYFSTTSSLAANAHEIYNNVICGRAGTYNYGIYTSTSSSYAANFRVLHNTVKLLNASYGYCFYNTGTNAGNSMLCMNNIFALGTTNAGYYPAYFSTSPTNPSGGQAINNNIYYSVGSSSANKLYRGAAYTAANYNTATAGGDSSSLGLPGFTSTFNDGHLMDACNRAGSPIGSYWVPTDMDGQTRSLTAPLVGADEVLGVNDNMMATVLLTPAMPISTGAQDLNVRVKNVGANNVTSFNVSYQLNGGTPVTQSWSGTLAPCTDTLITFTSTNQITLGAVNNIKVYTSAPNSTTDADPTNDTIAVLLKAPLSGIYTIGTGGNYPTFQAASADLANGVAGPVTFKVLAGTYTGQVVVNGPIPGANATNTVTFEGDTAATRILNASAASNSAFLINGANYVKLRNLTINNTANGSTVVGIIGSTSNNAGTGCSVTKCILNLNAIQTTSYGVNVTGTAGGYGQSANNVDSISIDSNTITNAYYAISIYGNTGSPSVNYNRNHKIRNNNINNVYYMGMYVYYIYNQLDILNNNITFPLNSTQGYGIYSYYCNNPAGTTTQINNNKIIDAAYSGIYWYGTGTGSMDVINNATAKTNYAYNYGMYLYAASNAYVRILHNTFVQDLGQSSNTYGPFIAYLPSNSIVKNNIFANTATSGTQTPCYLYSAPSAANSVNNNIYWNGAGTAAIYRGAAYTSANFNTPTAGGDSSFFANPKFVSASNVAVTTCFNGADLTAIVPKDIAGVIRNVPPKIGAYENTTPISYASSNTIQNTGFVAPGATNYPVLRIPVVLNGCGTGYTTNFYFNTTGSTNPGTDISAAKLYRTGTSSTFNTSKLLGTVTSPSGQFTFAISDTVNRDLGDTVNYWLAYDVAVGATNTNLLDARVDSFTILGANRVPSNNNPTGNLVIAAPMTYISSTSIHPDLSMVAQGSLNNQMLRIAVVTSATGSPIEVSSFALATTGGGRDTLNISNAKIYYTGNSATFSTATLFGSYTVSGATSASWPAYAITGTQQLTNGTNYFWLTYDMKAAAIIGDSIDAEVTTVTVSSVAQTPTVSAPAGIRKIRAEYCTSNATSTADEEIWNVTIGGINNTSTCTTTGGPGSILSEYSNYTNLVATLPAGIPAPFSVLTSSCGGNYTSFLVIYIDYNQDGDFVDAGETTYTSGSFTGSTAGIVKSGTITVPCTATPGLTRMRVIYVETSTTPASCGTYTWGETEDYTVNIVNGPATFQATTAMQISGSTSAGATDVAILRVPVKVTASPCNPSTITEFNFNTAGTSSVGNILAAKLYKTGSSATFNVTNLVGTVYSPSGNFSFFVTDTANNDTNNYWLAYDVSSSATNGATLDARFDSVQAFGSYYTPAVAAPTGNRVVAVPMTYISSSASHPNLSSVQPGSTNNQMLRIMVRTSSTGAPVALTQFALATTGGGLDTSNIANAKIYYTGNSANFSTTTQFGSTYTVSGATSASWPAYVINGNQQLNNDTNYFWLTYDLKASAVLLDSVDAELTGLTVASVAQTPTAGAPAGNRRIRGVYCASNATTTFDGEILDVTLNGVSNTTSCSTTGGVGSLMNEYSNFTDVLTPVGIYMGAPSSFSVHAATCGGNYTGVVGIFIDYNQDGDFTDPGETVHMTGTFTYGTGVYRTGNFIVPSTATLGVTRMRVILMETTITPISPCGTYGYGETEDYSVNILPAVGGAYVWNGSTNTNVQVPANWTPVRSQNNPYDKLIFNSSTPISLTNVASTYLGAVELTPSTVVNMTAAAGSVISLRDSLILGASSRLNAGAATIQLGWDTVNVGTLVGTGRINGTLDRFFNTSTVSLDYPLTDANNNNRTASIAYTTFPVASGSLSARFVSANPGNTGLPLTDISSSLTANRAGINGYWDVASATTGGVYSGTFTAGGFTGVNNYSLLFLMRRADAVSSWNTIGTHVTTTGTNALPVLSRTGMASYGQFGVGGDTTFNPLPVSMLFFNARNIEGSVHLNWATASEVNNKGFMIERSVNGNEFTDVEFVKGNGNSNKTINYVSIDKRAFEVAGANQLYYRLRQVDFDGTVSYSNIVIVNQDDQFSDAVSVFPNPFVGTTGIKVETNNATTAVVELTDMQGRLISTETVKVNAGNGYYQLRNVENLNSGVYFVNINMNGVKQTIKVIKTH